MSWPEYQDYLQSPQSPGIFNPNDPADVRDWKQYHEDLQRRHGIAPEAPVSPIEAARQTMESRRAATGAPATGPRSLLTWQHGTRGATGGLTADESQAIDAYSARNYMYINSLLHKGKHDFPSIGEDVVRKQLADMDSAMSKSAIQRPTTVWRGVDGENFPDDTWQPGREITEKGFLSTSGSSSVAKRFATSESGTTKPVIMKIKAPAGTHAVQVVGHGDRETILDRGQRLQITSAVKRGKTWHVEAEIVGQAKDAPSEPQGSTGTPSGGVGTGEGLPGASEATEGPEKPYVVITQHGPEREVRRTGFDTYDQAKAWMDANNPDTDGSMVPNIDPAYLSHPNYESGGFYAKTNRYAAIHHNPPVEPPPADPVVPHVRFDGIAPAPKRLNRDKVMDRYGIRVTHKQIPPESPYHLAATDGFYPSGGVRLIHKRGGVHGRDDVSSEPDINNLQPVTVTRQDLHNMQRYSDLIDRNTGETRAFMGYDPESDMVFTEDPENGNEEWVPRKQLIAKHLPNDPYMYRVQPEGPIKDGIYRHGEIG